MFKGIDVSYYQKKPYGFRYKKFKDAGWDFIIARIGYAYDGYRNPDSTFDHNYNMCKKYGIKFGVYFYSNAKNADMGRDEAKYVLKLLNKRKIDYPIWIDIEDNATSGKASPEQLAAAARAFCRTIEAAGYKAGVYASYSWIVNKIGDISDLHKWVAQYNETCSYSGKHDMWQYSSTDTVPGFKGRRDVNKCYVDYTNADKKEPAKYAGKLPALPRRGYFKLNDKGSNVKLLQAYLNWSVNAKLKQDNVVGPKTINSVNKFQEKFGLTEDGLFGKECLEKAKAVKL